ncbi:hypothetical protein LCGC14_2331950 [marine sediment metagenome]|uniref:Uncharacterized protein n=1 Tax=marine sediment metagenome TaxID=412755 RepID=A0A0F9ESC5_9ZZZZ
MAVSTISAPTIVHMPQQQPNDVVGKWFGIVQALGDVSGGFVVLTVRIPGEQFEKYLWNLEDFSGFSDGVDPGYSEVVYTLQTIQGSPGFLRSQGSQGPGGGIRFSPSSVIYSFSRYSIAEGGAPSIYGAHSLLRWSWQNNISGQDYYLYAFGYCWDRSELRRLGLPPRFPGGF